MRETLIVILNECEGSITVMRESVSIGSSFAIEAISAYEYPQSHRVRQLLIRRL